MMCVCVCRQLQRRVSVSWFTVQMDGIEQLKCVQWPVCFWIRTTGRSEDSWYKICPNETHTQ